MHRAVARVASLTLSRMALARSLAFVLVGDSGGALPSSSIMTAPECLPSPDTATAGPKTSDGGGRGLRGLGEDVPGRVGDACESASEGKTARGIGGKMTGKAASAGSYTGLA